MQEQDSLSHSEDKWASEEQRLAAIMFTDLCGYTELTQRNEALALELVQEHRRLVRPIILSHDGIEIKTMGDSFMVEFRSVLHAVSSAIEIQRTISKRNVSALKLEPEIQLRIGIHIGDVIHEGGDIYGDAVNIASRIESQARPGAIWLSRPVADQVKGKIDAELESLGMFALKGVSEKMELYSVNSSLKVESAPLIKEELPRISNRLAVLPLDNMTGDSSEEYFVDGLTEDIIGRLSSIRSLRIIARSSIMRYKETKKGAAEIGGELGVRTLLGGSVRKSGNRVRVSVELTDVGTEERIWSHTYDKELEDVFAIQTQIAKSVAESLKMRLAKPETERVERTWTVSQKAHNLYLRGRHLLNKRTREDLQRAITLFEEATKEDPGFALAYTGLSDSYCLLGIYGSIPPDQALEPARKYSMKGIELDNNLAEAHASLGHIVYHYEWDWDTAEREFKQALGLNPNYASAHHWYSEYLGSMGRMDEALSEIRKAQELDPLSLIINTHLGFVLYASGDYQGAINQLQKVLEMNPKFPPAREILGVVEAEQHNISEAEAEIKKAIEFSGGSQGLKASLAYAYAICGKQEEAIKILGEIKNLSDQYISPDSIAQVLSGLKERDEAFDWLEKAYATRSSHMVNIKIEPAYYNLHADPRFSDLLKRMKLSQSV